MKKYILLILFALAVIRSSSQTMIEQTIPKSYIGISSGINNSCGLLGVQFEQQLNQRFTIFSAIGLGSWGNKVTLGTRIYSKVPLGSALGISLSCATGMDDVKEKLEVIDSTGTYKKDVVYNAKPIYLMNLTWIKFWQVGLKNRFSLELGYSLNLSQNSYEMVPSTLVLSNESKKTMRFAEPGGLVIGFGFHFGL